MKSHGKLVRMLRATLLTICILLLFAASTGLAARQETVTMWAFPLCSDDIEMYSKLVNEFEKENPNIKVHVEVLPWQGRMEKLMAALAANQAPDVMYLNVFLVPKLAATGTWRPSTSICLPALGLTTFQALSSHVSMMDASMLCPYFRVWSRIYTT